MVDQPFPFDEHFERQLDPHLWAKRKALALFTEIREVLGDEKARQVFAVWGMPPSDRRLNEIENMAILDRLDFMPGGPNIKELARQIASERYVDPSGDQVAVVERHIRRLNAKRKQTPYWPQRQG
jgi:hypothetical protein